MNKDLEIFDYYTDEYLVRFVEFGIYAKYNSKFFDEFKKDLKSIVHEGHEDTTHSVWGERKAENQEECSSCIRTLIFKRINENNGKRIEVNNG